MTGQGRHVKAEEYVQRTVKLQRRTALSYMTSLFMVRHFYKVDMNIGTLLVIFRYSTYCLPYGICVKTGTPSLFVWWKWLNWNSHSERMWCGSRPPPPPPPTPLSWGGGRLFFVFLFFFFFFFYFFFPKILSPGVGGVWNLNFFFFFF